MATKKFGLLCYATLSQAIAEESPKNERPEIHLNIWEQEKEAFLDIGLMFNMRDPTDTIELIFPWPVDINDVIDLSSAIATPDAIPAIFNESWAVRSQGDDHVVYDPLKISPSFALVGIEGVWEIKQHTTKWGSKESTVYSISISIEKLKTKATITDKATATDDKSIEKLYIRFRVLNIKKDFYCVGADNWKDDISAVLQQKTEDIDFRLNVRRGAPPNLAKELGRSDEVPKVYLFLEFSKVHLFLMRSRDKDIIFQGKKFNASRSLEDEDFWARYSLITDTDKARKQNLSRVKRSLGYQWKDKIDGDILVKEFGILARFRITRLAVWKFISCAIFLGFVGNLILEGIKWKIAKEWPDAPVQAICVMADKGVVLPKQSCVPEATTVPPSRPADALAPQNKE